MASPQPVLRQPSDPHVHALGETCPVCDQPIPNDKAEAVRARVAALSDREAAAERLIAAKGRRSKRQLQPRVRRCGRTALLR